MAGMPKEQLLKVRTELQNAVVVRPGDTLVLVTPHTISQTQGDEIKQHLRAELPGAGPVVISGRTGLAVYRGEQPDDAAIEKWIRANPKEFEAWVMRYNRIHGGRVTR